MQNHEWVTQYFDEFRQQEVLNDSATPAIWLLSWASAFAAQLKQNPKSREQIDQFINDKIGFLSREFKEFYSESNNQNAFEQLVTYFFEYKSFQTKNPPQYTEEDFSVGRAMQTRIGHPLIIGTIFRALGESLKIPVLLLIIDDQVLARPTASPSGMIIHIQKRGQKCNPNEVLDLFNKAYNKKLIHRSAVKTTFDSREMIRALLLELKGYYTKSNNSDCLLVVLEALHLLEGIHVESLMERAVLFSHLGKSYEALREVRRVLTFSGIHKYQEQIKNIYHILKGTKGTGYRLQKRRTTTPPPHLVK
jgi:regulator of sirC expression with transglutaminase-like and TPR domain